MKKIFLKKIAIAALAAVLTVTTVPHIPVEPTTTTVCSDPDPLPPYPEEEIIVGQ